MKSLKPFWIPGLLALWVFLCAGAATAQPGPRISFQTFYDELEPYGRWVQHDRYGYVWLPDARPDFQPYATDGHWVVTDYGNTWVSDYAWGWAPFHYGRWFYDDYYGWSWVPDPEWGPAWVSWRNGGGYYGWAPLGPGMGISSYDIPVNYWCFVPEVYIVRPRIITFCVPRPRVVVIYRNTRHLDNIYRYQNRAYVYGPRREEIERVTRSQVAVYRVDHGDRPGRTQIQDHSVRIYRPEVYQNQKERSRPRNLATSNPRNDRNDGNNDRSFSGQDRLGRERAGGVYNGPADRSREGRPQPVDPGLHRGSQQQRNYPERGARMEGTSAGRENITNRGYPDRTIPAYGQEQVNTDTRVSRQQVVTRESQRTFPERSSVDQARERGSRGTTLAGEVQQSRESHRNTGGYSSRGREAVSSSPAVSPVQSRREQSGESPRPDSGRSRRE